ncbi:MAG: aspartate aminotransferase family protein, partial [Coriobacteriia bacterium]|nr:aspartate aminotransferase family protein [Coriobacteriia bacterium]
TCLYFTRGPVTDWCSASKSDTDLYGTFFRAMLDKGFWLAPSQFEACFASLATSNDDINAMVAAAGEVLTQIGKGAKTA